MTMTNGVRKINTIYSAVIKMASEYSCCMYVNLPEGKTEKRVITK